MHEPSKSDKARMLAAIRAATVPATALPPPEPTTVPPPAAPHTFATALRAGAGECLEIEAPSAMPAAIAARHPDARVIYSLVDAVPGTFQAPPPAKPHAYATVDVAVVPGHFGVCETGAVWVDSTCVPQPAVLFLAQHLVLVVARDTLVGTMQDAFTRLAAEGPMPDFGVFIAGPSKTADIEQCLVIGAHGPRSLTVLLIS